MVKVELKIKEIKDNEVEMEVEIERILSTEKEELTLEEVHKRLRLDQKEQRLYAGEKINKEDIKELIELLKSI